MMATGAISAVLFAILAGRQACRWLMLRRVAKVAEETSDG